MANIGGVQRSTTGGVRYEFKDKGSFVRKGFTMNYVLSYRDTYDKYGLPRDVMKTITRDMKAVENYIRSSKAGKFDAGIRNEYFKVIRDYYTVEGPTHAGERPASRFAPFLGEKSAQLVLKDMKRLAKELENPVDKPEFED